jgi:hypothetical protein
LPCNAYCVERYLAKAFGDHLADVRAAMEGLAARYDRTELNRIGFRLYEGWGAKAVLEIGKILAAG